MWPGPDKEEFVAPDLESNMENLGFSDCMGPELRAYVEAKLVLDLNLYLSRERVFQRSDVLFDWSECCVEGHRTRWLDGEIENFSGIALFDNNNRLIAEGWMQFIETEDGLEVFWWYLSGGDQHGVQEKNTNTVPIHVWERLSSEVRLAWRDHAPKEPFR